MKSLYVQYGCGLSAPEQWVNFDASPTLRVQKTPLLGTILKKRLNTIFPSNVRYGDIIKGLPVDENSCDGIYCSHTLEHLALADLRAALKNTYKLLKPSGIFRCVVPDLEFSAREYVKALDKGDNQGSMEFMRTTLLGIEERPRGAKGFFTSFMGNSHHLWMWDKFSLANELSQAGFRNIRFCAFNDSKDDMFRLVEEKSRFENAAALECSK
ncbi:MAG TPA: methyltransferase domain-containing protein [Puia sp.]|nr:methyltransferase domain-containing protein [Puia sp.]